METSFISSALLLIVKTAQPAHSRSTTLATDDSGLSVALPSLKIATEPAHR